MCIPKQITISSNNNIVQSNLVYKYYEHGLLNKNKLATYYLYYLSIK